MLSEKHNAFLRLLKNKGFKEERMTRMGLYAIGKSQTPPDLVVKFQPIDIVGFIL